MTGVSVVWRPGSLPHSAVRIKQMPAKHTPGSPPQVSRDMWRIEVETKHCYACDETKTFSEFYRNRARRDGLDTYCAECKRRKFAEFRRDFPKRHRLPGIT